MHQRKLMDRIAAVSKLTPTERKLARFFEREAAALAFEDLEGLSTKTGISQSTISRFVTKLGYENFREFSFEMRRNAANEYNTPLKWHPVRPKGLDTPEAVLHQHLNDVGMAMQLTLESIRSEEFARALDLVADEKRQLYLMGGVNAEPILGTFFNLLGYVRSNVTQLRPDLASVARRVAGMEQDAVLFAVCNTPFSVSTGTVMQHFMENGNDVILITNSYSCPYFRFATVPLVIYRSGRSTFSTRCTMLALMEAFTSALYIRYGNQYTDRYKNITDLLYKFGVFEAK